MFSGFRRWRATRALIRSIRARDEAGVITAIAAGAHLNGWLVRGAPRRMYSGSMMPSWDATQKNRGALALAIDYRSSPRIVSALLGAGALIYTNTSQTALGNRDSL